MIRCVFTTPLDLTHRTITTEKISVRGNTVSLQF